MMAVDRKSILAAAKRIAIHVRVTPIIETMIDGVSGPVTLKLEQLQHTGSFKPRGAFNTMLSRAIPPAGVAAASGGNHGAAVAYAAQRLGHKARIFVPMATPSAKLSRIASYDAEIVQSGASYYEAVEGCAAYVAETGALNIHAYDEVPTLDGQGTLGSEIESQAPDLDTLLVAVGGGGLIGGIAAWFAGRVKVVGVEPENCNSLHAALAAGKPVKISPSGIAVDSLGASFTGALMFPIAQRHVDHVALVSDDAIRAAQIYLWRNLQLVAEPGGAVAFAALLSGAYRPAREERVGLVMCGANTALEAFGGLFATPPVPG